jgi:hypothetical protein
MREMSVFDDWKHALEEAEFCCIHENKKIAIISIGEYFGVVEFDQIEIGDKVVEIINAVA